MFSTTSKLLYQPLRADHSHMLASRRSVLVELFSHLDLDQVGLRSPLEKVQIVLEQGLVANDAFEYQEAVRVLVGDELTPWVGFEWVTVDDEYGSKPAVAPPSKWQFFPPSPPWPIASRTAKSLSILKIPSGRS